MPAADWLNAGTDAWSAALLRAAWQGAVAILLVALFTRALPALPPAWRCWLWRGACAKLLLALAVSGAVALPLLPAEPSVPGPAAAPNPAPTPAPRGSITIAHGAHRDVTPPAPTAAVMTVATSAAAPAPPASALPRGAFVLFAAWAIGVAAYVVRLFRDHARARAIRRRATPVQTAFVLDACRTLCTRLQIRSVPRVLVSSETGTPLLVGVVHPVVILPAGKGPERDGDQHLRMMLAHELAHLKRRDLAWNWLPTAATAVFWFHPLAWFAGRELRLAQESACDALAMSATGAPPRSYATMLLDVIAASKPFSRLPRTAAAAVVETRSSVERRLHAMNRFHTAPSTRGVRAALCASAVAFAVAAVVPWRLVAQTPGGAGGAPSPADPAGAFEQPAATGEKPETPGRPPAAASIPAGAGAGGPTVGAAAAPGPEGAAAVPEGAVPGPGGVTDAPGDKEFRSDDAVLARGHVLAPEYALSTAVNGTVSEVSARQGQRVKKGEVLVRLDDAALRTEVIAAEARLTRSQIVVRRMEELLERKNATPLEVAVAKSELRELEAKLQQTQLMLERARIVAPVDGVVSRLRVRPGGAAREGEPLAVVLALDELSFTVHVGASELPRLQEGQEAKVKLDALPGETFDAVVSFISPQVNSGSGTAEVEARLKGAAGDKLRPGLAGTVAINAPRR